MNYSQLCVLFYFRIQHFPVGSCTYFTWDWDWPGKNASLVFFLQPIEIVWRVKYINKHYSHPCYRETKTKIVLKFPCLLFKQIKKSFIHKQRKLSFRSVERWAPALSLKRRLRTIRNWPIRLHWWLNESVYRKQSYRLGKQEEESNNLYRSGRNTFTFYCF